MKKERKVLFYMIISCPECGKKISDKAKMCLNCGYPLDEYSCQKEEDQQPQTTVNEEAYERVINVLNTNTSFIFEDNEQLATEVRKLIIDNKLTQKEISKRLGIVPQMLVKYLNKKNLAFNDIKEICNVMDVDLCISFVKRK